MSSYWMGRIRRPIKRPRYWQRCQLHTYIPSPEHQAALYQTLNAFPDCSSGVVIFMRDEDYSTYERLNGARGMLCRLGREERESSTLLPPDIRSVIRSESFSHLLWLSANTYRGTVEDFIWDLAHELRHLQQERECPALFDAGNALAAQHCQIWGNESNWIQSPTELDCELAAWRVLQHLRPDTAVAYLRRQIDNPGLARANQLLLMNDPDRPYPVFTAVLQLLARHEPIMRVALDPDYEAIRSAITARLRLRGHAFI